MDPDIQEHQLPTGPTAGRRGRRKSRLTDRRPSIFNSISSFKQMFDAAKAVGDWKDTRNLLAPMQFRDDELEKEFIKAYKIRSRDILRVAGFLELILSVLFQAQTHGNFISPWIFMVGSVAMCFYVNTRLWFKFESHQIPAALSVTMTLTMLMILAVEHQRFPEASVALVLLQFVAVRLFYSTSILIGIFAVFLFNITYVFTGAFSAHIAILNGQLISSVILGGIASYHFEFSERTHFLKLKTVVADCAMANYEKDKLVFLVKAAIPSKLLSKLPHINIAERFVSATVAFISFDNLIDYAHQLEPEKSIQMLNEVFNVCEARCQEFQIEKIKTFQNKFMAVSGIPLPEENHAEKMADMLMTIVQDFSELHLRFEARYPGFKIRIRIGVSSGPLVAGVIGTSRFCYDVWGDTVNVASRLETPKSSASDSTVPVSAPSSWYCSSPCSSPFPPGSPLSTSPTDETSALIPFAFANLNHLDGDRLSIHRRSFDGISTLRKRYWEDAKHDSLKIPESKDTKRSLSPLLLDHETTSICSEIRLSESTYQLLKSTHICSSAGTMKVKGKKDPIQVYHLKDRISKRIRSRRNSHPRENAMPTTPSIPSVLEQPVFFNCTFTEDEELVYRNESFKSHLSTCRKAIAVVGLVALLFSLRDFFIPELEHDARSYALALRLLTLLPQWTLNFALTYWQGYSQKVDFVVSIVSLLVFFFGNSVSDYFILNTIASKSPNARVPILPIAGLNSAAFLSYTVFLHSRKRLLIFFMIALIMLLFSWPSMGYFGSNWSNLNLATCELPSIGISVTVSIVTVVALANLWVCSELSIFDRKSWKLEHAARNIRREFISKKEHADQILRRIVPAPLLDQFVFSDIRRIAQSHRGVVLLSSDVVDFTRIADEMGAVKLVKMLNFLFTQFDDLAEMYGLEEVKTLGDSYLAAAGLFPKDQPFLSPEDQIPRAVDMALDMQELVKKFSQASKSNPEIRLRIGVHFGKAVSGIIGHSKFQFDVFGDAVSVTEQLEHTGKASFVHISAEVMNNLRQAYTEEQLKAKYRIIKNVGIDRGNTCGETWLISRVTKPAPEEQVAPTLDERRSPLRVAHVEDEPLAEVTDIFSESRPSEISTLFEVLTGMAEATRSSTDVLPP